MASAEEVELNVAHAPHENAIEAFGVVLHQIKNGIVKSRYDWDQHEPRMWARAHGITDHQLVGEIDLKKDLLEIRSGKVAYGTIIFGKIRVGTNDGKEGVVHVRIIDPPNRGDSDVKFHSIFTECGAPNAEGHPTTWNAIHPVEKSLEFFNE